jgi:stage V sporulation protein D (sporulation-specific penicillin-binding protein)
MMQVAARIGNKTFYDYFISFGFTSKTGIDLPGEENGIYTKLSGFNAVELACYSFGQTFKTTPIRQLTAIAAIANGGYLVTPHIVSAITDSRGNVIEEYEYGTVRQVVSKGVCALIRDVLEDGVSGQGGAKNAYVAGYKIAAKTGTSEKRDKINPATGKFDLRIASCVAMAPADSPRIVAILVVDEPHTDTVYGSALAAPYMANLMADVLPYLGVERKYSDEEMSRIGVTVGKYVGFEVSAAQKKVTDLGVNCVIVGKGDKVIRQIPEAGSQITKINGTKIILYTEEGGVEDPLTVPNVKGMTASVAITTLQSAGFNVYIKGSTNFTEGAGAVVIDQIPADKTLMNRGDVVTIVCRYLDGTD